MFNTAMFNLYFNMKKVFLSVLVICVLLFSLVSIAEVHALTKAKGSVHSASGPKAFGHKTSHIVCGDSLYSEVKHDDKASQTKPTSGVAKSRGGPVHHPALFLM
jgi:hypothetical protein